jgi:acyl transferase domain-containing protein/NAD(P)-dependent dehydrogenase (short-subunit alcohol dehydrogenase family)/acyl carrier protein
VKAHDRNPSTSDNSELLAIIGIGCLFPQANDRQAYWSNISEGVDSITDIPPTHWKVADYFDQDQKSPDRTYGQRGGFISAVDFNPMEFNIPPNALEAIDTSQLLGLVAAGQALRDAGYGPERQFDRSRASVILGVTGALELVIPLGARLGHPIWKRALKEAGVEQSVADDVAQRISDAYVPWQENSFPGLLGNVVAGRISKQFDLGGTNCVVDAACASSFSALHLAAMELATGKSDMVITGGIDTFNDIFMYMCFSKTPALSPGGNAKPFDASADGTTLGEGLGIVVIKRLADAERDNDRIYAVIRGIGSSSDGKGDAIYAPSATGQKKALLDAYDRAAVSPESIGLLEAHGTGTTVGDLVEVSALRDVYGEAATPWCSLSSVKSQIGHTKAAAGAAGMIKAALALHHKVLPPTIKIRNPLKEVTGGASPFYLSTEKRPWLPRGETPRRAAVSAFGFGGSNFHLVLEEYRSARAGVEWNGHVQIIPFSGIDTSQLETALANLPLNGSWEDIRRAAAAARISFDAKAPCRLALVVERNLTRLGALVANALTMLEKSPHSAWNTPDGAFFAHGEKPGSLAMLFPGQGTQYTGMLRDLACYFPQALETLATADSGFPTGDGKLLSDLIYPASAFDNETRERREEELRATRIAQPAIGAVSLAALKILAAFNVLPDAVAGHSYGELTALCAAGCYDESEFHQLSRLRGRLMAEGSGDRGGMLAVQAALATVESMIAEAGLDLVIANRNAPLQAVLSGSSAEIQRAATIFSERNINARQLPVAAAFHSPLVSDAALPFLAGLDKLNFKPARIPVYANSTAAEYPHDTARARELLAHQLARPVEFVAQIEAMYAAGVRSFVEVGPGARLTGLVSAILGKRDHVALALDASSGQGSGMTDLARALARLSVLAYPVDLNTWDGEYQPPLATGRKPAMTIPICGANYVKPRPDRPPLVHPRPGDQGSGTGNREPVKEFSSPRPQVPNSQSLMESLAITRAGVSALQKMQEDTANLHRRFLEGQETASRAIQTLLEQQQSILRGGEQNPLPCSIPVTTAVAPPAEPVVAPASVKPPTATSAPPAPLPGNNITKTLLAVVSEKTGYPVEMLELDMGMDSDLGIDSIKRVEILSSLQERLPEAPVIGPEQLGTLRTLADIVSYLSADAAPLAEVLEQPAATARKTEPACNTTTVNRSTIVPVPLGGARDPLPLAANGDLWVTDDGSSFSTALRDLLAEGGRTVRLLAVEEARQTVATADLSGLVIVAPATGTGDTFLEQAFLLLKSAGPTLRRAAATGGALLTAISRLDGSFGCGVGTVLSDPLSGGLAGLVKTAAHEWPGVSCKAIDLGSFPEPGAAVRATAHELLLSGPLEVGLTPGGRITLELVSLPTLQTPLTPPIREGEVVVVTGGGRGVTTEATVALAQAYRPLLVLLGRSRLQTDEPDWLAGLTDESLIKRAILDHATEKPHPRAIEEQYRALTAGRELRATLARVTAAGGTALYCSVDIRDSGAVNELLGRIRREHGPIRGIIHGAGVLADRLITDKTREQFAMVYGTKVGGLRSLLEATAGDDLRFIALFASTTGRFGRTGQVDYAVANEVLNKLAQAEARRRAACRCVSINWGPWDGGMVTPALKKVFAGEGVGLIGLAEGGELLIREIAAKDAPVEVVAMAATTREARALPQPLAPKQLGEAFSLTLSVDDYPFLRSHVIDGKAVLPMAMVAEWLSHGALHGNPGLRFHGFNDLRICKGVVFEHGAPCNVRIMAGRAEKRDSLYNVTVELLGVGYDGRAVLHARAEIVLARKLPEGLRSIPDLPVAPHAPYNGQIYDPQRLFHGPDLHGIEQVESCSAKGISALVKTAPQPSSWIKNPFRSDWISDPLSMDSAFQLMILWSFERFGAGSLPCFAGRYRQYLERFPREGVQVLVRVTAEREHGATADMEFLDRQSGKLVARLEGYECVIDPSLAHAFQRNQLPRAGNSALRAA